MYLDHFGLTEPPFRITPHTEFFFAGANRGATLDALVYAILNDQGIVTVSGEVGSGKTMLCRMLMERLPKHVVLVYLANPSLSREDIVFAIADELGLQLSETSKASAAIRALQEKLIELHADGRQVVVLADEAHAMPLETLEQVRLLSNLETSHHKLLQLVLFGQPELDDVLARSDMRQLRERITQNFVLEPLHRDDIARYIDFRMRMAGYHGPEAFSHEAVRLIAKSSEGLTRRVNILAEKSLLATFAGGVHQVTPNEVRAAIRDTRYDTSGNRKKAGLLVAGGFALAGVLLTSMLLRSSLKQEDVAGALATPPASATPNPPLRNEGVASVPTVAQQGVAGKEPPIPVKPQPQSGEKRAIASSSTPASRPQAPTDQKKLGATAELRIHETREWIKSTAADRWFIQLVTANTGDMSFVTQFLEKADQLLEPKRAGLYIADLGNEQQRVGIIYGDFENQDAALQEIARLPAELRANKPFPRQVIRLK
jgi:type II secretory pathway predicted ATPase ExeA